MLSEYAIPLAALAVSLFTFLSGQIAQKKLANHHYVESIENRVERLERELVECNRERTRLQTENIDLMRRLVGEHQ